MTQTTFIDLSDHLFKGTATVGMLFAYLWWSTPQFLYYIIAIAVLLAALVTIGALTKSSELIVMRACGISLYRTAVPLLVAALGAAAVLFALEERLLAAANRRASQLSYVIRGQSPRTIDVLHVPYQKMLDVKPSAVDYKHVIGWRRVKV